MDGDRAQRAGEDGAAEVPAAEALQKLADDFARDGVQVSLLGRDGSILHDPVCGAGGAFARQWPAEILPLVEEALRRAAAGDPVEFDVASPGPSGRTLGWFRVTLTPVQAPLIRAEVVDITAEMDRTHRAARAVWMPGLSQPAFRSESG